MATSRSGTEEQYNVIHQLMDDAASYFADIQKEEGVKKIKKKAKEGFIRSPIRDTHLCYFGATFSATFGATFGATFSGPFSAILLSPK